MTWSYREDIPTALDFVRSLIGDTDETAQRITDEEITSILEDAVDLYEAASEVCGRIGAKYLLKADVGARPETFTVLKGMSDAYFALQERLYKHATQAIGPYVGGTGLGETQGIITNPDRIRPAFTRHENEDPSLIDDEKKY